MSAKKHGKGWIIGLFILLALLAVTVTTNYQKSDKIKYLNSQLSAAEAKTSQPTSAPSNTNNSQGSSSGSSATTITPPATPPSPSQTVNAEQSWSCDSPVEASSSMIDLNVDDCSSTSGGTEELSCNGSIDTNSLSTTTLLSELVPLNMTCSTQ